MIARRVDASQHDLVTQHEATHEFLTIYLQRPIARWYAGHHVHSVDGQCVNEVKFEAAIPVASKIRSNNLILSMKCSGVI